ncbi:MAG: hypothetical protein F4034_05250 [Chloroflexi bacterium]|nr:hypothetical protein [Chloroflexota bacterium]
MSGDERFRLTLATAGILFFLALAVVILRFHRLSEHPPGLYFDEGANGLDALQVLQGKHSVYFPENSGREPLGIYLMALAISILGRTELALRVPTATASACTVFAVFWLGRLLFGHDDEAGRATPWRGLLVGGAAAGFLTVSLSQTVLGRIAFRIQLLPLLLTLGLALLWWAWNHRVRHSGAWWQVALAGACTGLVAYSYIPARFTPLLFIFFGLTLVMSIRSRCLAASPGKKGLGHSLSFIHASQLRNELKWVAAFVLPAVLIAAPLAIYFVLHPEHLLIRANQLWLFDPSRSQGTPLEAFWGNVWGYLLNFGFRGDQNWRHNYAGRPMLHPWETCLFWLGVAMSVWRWQQRPSHRLLLIWLGVLTLPATLAVDHIPPPNTVRVVGALPSVYLLIGVGLWESFRFLRDRFFPDNEITGAVSAAALVGCLVLVQGLFTFRAYFQEWAAAPELNEAYESIWTDLGHGLNEHQSTADEVYLIGLISDYAWHHEASMHHSFEFLYTGDAPFRIIQATTTHNLAPKIEATLAELEQVSTVHYVDWDNSLVGGNAYSDRQVTIILEKYGRYLKSESHDSFQVHSYADIDLNRPWTFYEHLEPLTVHYDGGISIHGFALGQGTAQLSQNQQFDLDQGRPWWIAIHWQIAPGLEAIYSVSLRMHDAGGGIVYQHDAVLQDSASSTTNRWQAGELVDTLHFLEVPSGLQPGEYELRLIVYDFETLKPTVELGVWEPETALTRLQLGASK